MKTKTKPKSLNFDDLRWCIANDFQVYLVPMDSRGNGKYKIAVRRRGITTDGKDYADVDGVRVDSKVTLGDTVYRSSLEATNNLNNVYGYLRRTYG